MCFGLRPFASSIAARNAPSPSMRMHSSVWQIACGATITLSNASSGLSTGVGSCSNTSIAAPWMRFSRSASISAASCTTGPRAVLMKYADGFIFANSAAPIRPCVRSSSRQFTDTKSDSASSVSRSTIVTPRSFTADCGTSGSQPISRRSNGFASRSTSRPMLPTPITPSVRPISPEPRKLPFSAQRPSRTRRSFRTIRCASAST